MTAGLHTPAGVDGDHTAFGKPDVRIVRLRSCDVWLADPVDQASLELAAPNGTARHRRLVAHWISKTAALPAKTGPLVTDGTVHLVGTGTGRPVERPVREVPKPPDAIRCALLGTGRRAEKALGTAELSKLLVDSRHFDLLKIFNW